MFRVSWKRGARVLAMCACACAAAGTRAESQPTRVQLANPAARKCLDDGHHLQTVRAADGLPIAQDCVDPSSGKRCDSWDYFRDQCRLPTSGSHAESDPLKRATE